MKICLISPYESVAAYGLRILSSVLKREGHDVTMIFLPLDFRESIPPSALDQTAQKAASSDLAGVSLSSNYFRMAEAITQAIRQKYDPPPVMWGGIHPTLEPEECLEHCDISCMGEAEEAVVELADKIQSGEDYTGVRNFFFRTPDGKILKNPLRPLKTDLDSIPFPDYSGENQWILHQNELVPVTDELLNENLNVQYLTLSSRGCVHNCAFCCNNFLKELYHGQKWFRRRSIQNIIEEGVWVKENLPWVEEVLFDDDAFMARTADVLEQFAEQWKKRVGIPFFVTGVTPGSLTEEKLKILLQGGLSRIRIGVQTASDRVNYEIYNRPIPHRKAEEAIGVIERHKRQLSRHHYDFIIDNPWESDEELLETLRFLLKIPRPWAINIYSLTFYPGTELFRKAKEQGLLSDKVKDVYDKSYKAYRPTYLNRLFYLFCQSRLPRWALSLFVNKWILKLRLNYPLWGIYVLLRDAKFHLRKLLQKTGKNS